MIKCGIDKNTLKRVDTLDEIINSTPNMVLAQVLRACTITIGGHPIKCLKDSVLTMPYNYYLDSKKGVGGVTILKPYRKKFKQVFKRYRGQDLTNKKLLIWRTGGLGDLMFIQPLIRYIKARYLNVKITLATGPHQVSLLMDWPQNLLDGVLLVPFDKKFLDGHDYHLSFEGAIERCNESRNKNYFDIFKTVANLDFNIKEFPPILEPNEQAVQMAADIVPKNTVLLQMRSSTAIKNMSGPKWKEVIGGLLDNGFNVGVIDMQKHAHVYEELLGSFGFDRTKVINYAAYSKTVNHGIAILANCVGLIGVDSSFTHFAAAINKPIVTIYGPFPGDLTLKYYDNSIAIEPDGWNECGKHPCLYSGREEHNCPSIKNKELPACIDSIDTDKIVKSFLYVKESMIETSG